MRSLQFYSQFHYYEYKAAAVYKLHPEIKLTLGAGSYQTYKEGGDFKLPKNNNEFRIWPQLGLYQQIGDLTIEQRYRSELRFTNNGYRNRFRYRFGISYPISLGKNTGKTLILHGSNELFFTDREAYFERNRISISCEYKLNKQTSIQLGYLHQFDYRINDETGRDFLVIAYYLTLGKNEKPRLEKTLELKEE